MSTKERILDLIAAKYKNRAEFERVANLKPQTVNDWERKSESFYKCIPLIAKVLGTTSAYLLCETDNPEPQLQLIANEKEHRTMKESLDKSIVEKGLNAYFNYEATQKRLGNSPPRAVKVLEDGRVPVWLHEKTEIPMARLKSFKDLKDCPVWEEFKKMLDAPKAIFQKNQLSDHADCIALLNELYDKEHFDTATIKEPRISREAIRKATDIDSAKPNPDSEDPDKD